MEQEVTNLAQPNSGAPQQKEQAPLHSAVTNFARFYKLFALLPYEGDRDQLKKDMVLGYTWNRTDSLRELTRSEYNNLCSDLERMTGYRDEQKRLRSECLLLMQKTGVDTSDWTRVNAFCDDKRIAGKVFARLGNDELKALQKKLRAILRRGGLRKREENGGGAVYVIQADVRAGQMPEA